MSKDTPDLSPTTPPTPEGAKPASTPVTPPAPAAAPQASTPLAAQEAPADDLVMEPVRPNVYARLGAEALGTFIFVFAGLGIALYTKLSGAAPLEVALGFGLAIMAAMVAFGHISGGHFNPAVTIGSAIAGRTVWIDVPLYWLAQIVGGALAAVTLFVTIPSLLPNLIAQSAASSASSSGAAPAAVAKGTGRTFFTALANGYGKNSPLAGLTKTAPGELVTFNLMPVLLVTIIASAVLVGIVLCATSRRAQHSLAPVAIGLTYVIMILVTTPISNGAINPATSTAAALFSSSWAFGQLWLFWLAPIIGAALAGLAYRAFATDPAEGNLLEEEALLVEQEILVDGERA